ncbi:enolase-phosphatase E1 [Yamadazyma tenuis]|uniref:Enolase-phosphatase E1 n=1 Tax=Candida tenuis (strain ATCC 10573 / BCRC 21748 / CBS 615 / JCM 9827 / NBRC 10315 / NRRL Y-1498 / VKM Y-70) TaxID=590646 RepID=G3BCC9_CANTC|nr:2,3-diketo-5-methylthio-1-phosphopentane phosphatase [Yamadazyma tenuis ATCC 10573]EGV60807.1 2,3-diketo-5-methylthio-1-phosphopentane phosphatase [Yamadazyma tenuis ATCC 10573]WEJ93927.1 enolase-phosphatase E1 [Yamadazyma tenuis]
MSPKVLVLDIEGTVCSISFVKDVLYPYFMDQFEVFLADLDYPLSNKPVGQTPTDTELINNIVAQFPQHATLDAVASHIRQLVANDVKDPILKSFQGFVWKLGYEKGDLLAPIYPDAINVIKTFSQHSKIYIYSSGSVKAQKLLFKYVKDGNNVVDLNQYLSGYFDITTAGSKQEASSYESILKSIGYDTNPSHVLFLSDNVKEIHAAKEAGIAVSIVDRPGNAPVSQDDIDTHGIVHSLEELPW